MESEAEDDNDASNEEEWTSSNEARSDCTDNDEVEVKESAVEAFRKLINPHNVEEFERVRLLTSIGFSLLFLPKQTTDLIDLMV